MSIYRVGIGASTFGQEDSVPLDLLRAAGVTVVPNPCGRRLTEAEITEYLISEHLDGLLAGLEPLNRRVLERARQNLKAIARVGIGTTNVDKVACAEFGIRLSYTPDGPTEAVAEMTLAALLCLTRDLDSMNRALHAGRWDKVIGRSLKELTVLVIGLGRIGRRVAEALAGLGCRIIVHDPFVDPDNLRPFEAMTLHAGLQQADVVTLHAAGTTALLGDAEFDAATRGLVVLNSARGELVDEAALVRALESGQVGKAWFDAFSPEPYTGRLAEFSQVLMTPHAATYTRRCRLSMESEAARNIIRDLRIGTGHSA